MKYADLIQFDPIESVVELRSADKRERAESLVRNYVISDAMAVRLTDVVFPQLQFRKPADNKGLMVVGNYGTGKSHLMAVLSAIAEHEEAVEALTNERVAEAAASVAGQFQVVRTELGSTQMRLRDFVCRELEAALDERGVTYQFPAYDQVGNHKGAFEDMMRAFEGTYPDQGLLLVVDELLDYLRTRSSQDLTLDLNFLREVGEVCRDTRFRFITGLQETLFDNPAFEFAASAVQRVTARFEQVIIAKQDVKYVVAERLLKKTPEQRGQVRDYLRRFASSYARMNERLEEYVELFPVHPDYVDTFALIHFVEQRQVLKTLSSEMRERMDEEVPTDRPGLIAYDSYWGRLIQDASLKSDPDVGEVIKVHDVLRSRIEQAFTRPEYAPMALRIIDALAVHRLTTRDVHTPLGATAAELRDGLCLYDPIVADFGGDPAEDLLSHVETVLQEILKTVSGQFISYNRDNRQYYIDLKKTEDFDAIIDRRAETMGAAELDRAYYDALRQVVGTANRPTYNNLHNIWEHEVTWLDRKAGREGYLFFGTPNERNTAIPPKDFYLYFLQPFGSPRFDDDERPDEVIFRLRERDDEFESALRRYAAAMAQWSTASTQAKAVYRQKADQSLKVLERWLSKNLMTAFEVTHEGRTKKMPEWLKGVNIREALGYGPQESASGTIADHVNLVGSMTLAPHFEATAPEYPAFSVLVAAQRRPEAAASALRVIRGGRPNKESTAVLDALELLDGDKIAPHGSRYAQWVLEKMDEKGHGQVLNRSELIDSVYGVEYAAPDRFRLEPEWLVVVLAALVHHGDLVLAVPGNKFSATDLEALAMTPVDDLAAFKHVERPKDWNVPALRALFDLVGVTTGEVNDLTQGKEEPVRKLEDKAEALAGRLAEGQQKLLQGLQLWGKPLLTDEEAKAYAQRMAGVKTFLESIQRYNSPAKLKNFKASASDIAAHEAGLHALRTVERLAKLAQGLGPLAQYLAQAETVLPETHDWTTEVRTLRSEVMAELDRPEAREDAGLEARLRAKLEAAKARYIKAYTALLREARLDLTQDQRKAEILHGDRVHALEALRVIPILPAGQLDQTKKALADLKATSTPGPDDLKHQPVFEGFQPVQERGDGTAAERLDTLDAQVDQLLDGWTETLLEALGQPATQERLKLLDADQQSLLADFQQTKSLPDHPPSPAFVRAVQEALKQLKGVPVKRDALVERLFAGGAAVTPDQLRERLDAFLRELADGTDASKVRILLES